MKKRFLLSLLSAVFCMGLWAQEFNTFTDSRDGKAYKFVKIGEQYWMSQNLNYETAESWCYDNNASNCASYGRLYTAAAARNACPEGWRLPFDTDWEVLLRNTAPKHIAGGLLKDQTSGLWHSPNTGANNSTGFTALPAGIKLQGGRFIELGASTAFWSLFDDESNAWGRHLASDSPRFNSYNNPEHTAYSIRCIKQ